MKAFLLSLLCTSLFLAACTPTTSTNSIPPTPLENGLWLPVSSEEQTPIAWVFDTANKKIFSIQGEQYPVLYDLTINEAGNWSATGIRETFAFSSTEQLLVMDNRDTTIYHPYLDQTTFFWTVDSLPQLDTLLQDTGVWKEGTTGRHLVFYQPICPSTIALEYVSFDKKALIFDTAQTAVEYPSDYRQTLSFSYQNGVLYFFLKNSRNRSVERYAVEDVAPNQWVLRSLSPPYNSIVWKRVSHPSNWLTALIKTHQLRLNKNRAFLSKDC